MEHAGSAHGTTVGLSCPNFTSTVTQTPVTPGDYRTATARDTLRIRFLILDSWTYIQVRIQKTPEHDPNGILYPFSAKIQQPLQI